MDLKKIEHEYIILCNQHKKYECYLMYIYYVLGGASTILLTIVSIYSGKEDYHSPVFVMSLIATLLNLIISFLRINEKTSLHHNFASGVYDIAIDIQAFLLVDHTENELRIFQHSILQLQKKVTDRAPTISPCMLSFVS